MRCVFLAVTLVATQLAGPLRADCAVRDFRTLPLAPSSDNQVTALEMAYPGAVADPAAGRFTTPDGRVIRLDAPRAVTGAALLDRATIGDMFALPYPLAFDLAPRNTPWADPGRARNDAFFRAMYGDSAAEVQGSLTTVTYRGQDVTATFQMTTRHCVAAQLQAALDVLAALSPAHDAFFTATGGSFNWRVIAGTDRLSSHSFGAAFDLNTELGGYWRWAGAAEGAVGAYPNQTPPDLVAILEAHGFIWGGKWHHYDGMHFEYRPDLILFAQLQGG